MNPPRISFSISFLSKLTEGSRIFIIGSVISVYGLILYEIFPEFLFNPTFALPYFVIPMAALAGIGIGLPRLMPIILSKVFKRPIKTQAAGSLDQGESGSILDELVTEEPGAQMIQQDTDGILSIGEDNPISIDNPELGGIPTTPGESPELLPEGTVGADAPNLGSINLGGLGEDKVRELIDEKFEPVEKDLSSFKKDLNKIKEDMKITKESVDTLTESFEGTLTDMKAFQAEISNPLNFMRKYFESLDLKSLQDPSLPLRQQLRASNAQFETAPIEQQPMTIPQVSDITNQISPPQPSTPQEPTPQISPLQDQINQQTAPSQPNPMDSVMKPLFSGNLSVGKMMSIVELAGDMLREQGDDCIDLLLEQCKLMGLKQEDENTIYNIIDMLKNSGMNVEDTLMQLYKFSQIVGMNDKEADSHYSRLLANRSRKKLEKGD